MSADDWSHIMRAADFIVANGPKTQQERWENQDGWSPNTIATEIAGLICAADVARRNGDTARAQTYEATADDWQRNVESWTATSNGPYSPKPYYLRTTKDANPNAGTTYSLGDNFPRPVDQREIVDNSFVRLVLFGTKAWNDPVVLHSLKVGDSTSAEPLRVQTDIGAVWRRFTLDGYGETADGGDWDIFPTAARQTLGRAWPLLAGERGIRAARRPQREQVPRNHGAHQQRRLDAPRASVGQPAAERGIRRGDPLVHAARLDTRAVRAARMVDPEG